MNLFTVPPNAPLLDLVAAEWLRRAGGDALAASRGVIMLPTRRAARALAEAFLRVSTGRPLLMPRITAIGALDEAPLALSGGLDLPPAVQPMQRLAALSRMILAMQGAAGAPRTADRAWRLAGDLAALMEEAELAEVALSARLPDAAEADFAAHWQQTLAFLRIVTATWPGWLAEQCLMNPASRRVAVLQAQAGEWERTPPPDPVLIAGTTAGVPAVARLLDVVARLPRGEVLLPGLDLALPDPVWEALGDTHPQAGMRRLLAGMNATREDVRAWPPRADIVAAPVRSRRPARSLPLWDWAAQRGVGIPPKPAGDSPREGESGVPEGRVALLRQALLPASGLHAWREPGPVGFDGMFRLEPSDQQEEAAAIALVLREALETPGARAALVTPDRELASRVATELLRWGIVADDSAGEPLAQTPPAVFLRLLVRAIAEELAPVPLLALFKHPFAAAGLRPAACRDATRELELLCLRGPRPAPGLPGLRRAVDHARDRGPGQRNAADLLGRAEHCLEPMLRVAASLLVDPSAAMAALIDAAERLAATDEQDGAARLWAAEEGEGLATHLVAVQAALPVLPDQPRASLPSLLDAVLAGAVVRTRRALRASAGPEHPRVFIWGLLEARLQRVEVMVLGGLAETVWPPATDSGPWMSRPMRERTGLPSPEIRVGEAAHDFVSAVCAAPRVVLSCPRRREGAPAVPARWLERLRAFLEGQGKLRLPEHPAVRWTRALDQPANGPRPVAPPRPCPDTRLRPRRVSVTEIETWLRDPYAIHARHILKLRKLPDLDESTDAADYGSIVHDGLHRFLREHGSQWPADAAEGLRRAMARSLAEAELRPALVAWWSPRIARIADAVACIEDERREKGGPEAVLSEAKASWDFARLGGPFTLVGRADRIERRPDARLAILDYKTGSPPFQSDVEAGLAPQLPLEACMAAEGAFGLEWQLPTAELSYWQLTGGYVPGKACVLFGGDEARVAASIAAARANLMALIDSFDDPARCYLSQPHPARAPRVSDYAQLARVAEWGLAGDEE